MISMGKLFGTSGIRKRISEYPKDFAFDLGASLGTYVSGKVAVGRDTRASGPEFEREFIRGVNSTGSDTISLGITPTPTVGVATSEYGMGVEITASHNPPDYNGFKFFDKFGAFKSKSESDLEKILESRRFKSGVGSNSFSDFSQKHIEKIIKVTGVFNDIKVLVDCAAGAGSQVTPKMLEVSGCKFKALNTNTDGVFPHGLEPTEKNLEDICKRVAKEDVDIAFAHDGDADRTCAIAADGKLIEWDSFLTALASKSKKAVTTVDASMRIEEFCKKVFRVAVGDVAVVEGIRKYDAGFGGEPSGTYIFPDIHIYPDGVATVAKTLEMVKNETFYDLINDIPTYPMQRIKIPCSHNEKISIMDKMPDAVKGENYSNIDGIRIERDWGWVLVRPSGTEDYIRITSEAKDLQKLEKLVKQAKQWIKACG